MGAERRFLIIASRFNDLITKHLVDGAREAFEEAGVRKDQVDLLWAPGAFELPVIAAKAARTHSYAGVVALGAVIRGDTPHFDYVAGECAAGLMRAGVETGVPCIFGVLTTNDEAQALARCGLKGGNKGADAARAALAAAKALDKLDELVRR
jgi:6,7-dimethyl-8-ribityllumazine synthase